jgi:hypothetical protein
MLLVPQEHSYLRYNIAYAFNLGSLIIKPFAGNNNHRPLKGAYCF